MDTLSNTWCSFWTIQILEKPQMINSEAGHLFTKQPKKGHLEVVKHLCNLLQDKNPSDGNGLTPVHSAAFGGHIDIVKYLVQFLDNKN